MGYLRILDTDEEDRQYEASIQLPYRLRAQNALYELGDFRGRGSNGTVFSARVPATGREVAIKFQHFLDNRRIERFHFEKQVLSQLSHPTVLKVSDEGVISGRHTKPVPFLVTHLFEGNLEREVMPDETTVRPMDTSRVVNIGRQIAAGLAYVHAQGVIHRDIKPGNFFIWSDNIVIGDFGLAKTATDEGALRFPRAGITLSTEKVGPQDFMSPELLRYAKDKSYPVDHRSDLWQTGAVLWFLLTGYPPRGKLDSDDVQCSKELFAVVDKLMESKPDKRFQTASEVEIALSNVPSVV